MRFVELTRAAIWLILLLAFRKSVLISRISARSRLIISPRTRLLRTKLRKFVQPVSSIFFSMKYLRKQFKDWAYSLCASVFFYEEDDEVLRDLHRQAMSAFGGIAPHYRIALYDDAPTLVWDFHSLLQTIQIIISFAITDKQHPLRLCKHCTKAFVAKDSRSVYCSVECKNAYNTDKKRGRQDTV